MNQFSLASRRSMRLKPRRSARTLRPPVSDLQHGADPPAYSLSQVQYGPAAGCGKAWARPRATTPETRSRSTKPRPRTTTRANQTEHRAGRLRTSGNCTVTQERRQRDPRTTCRSARTSAPDHLLRKRLHEAAPPAASSISPTGFSVSNTDVGEFGVGGMRGHGTGSIAASGITGPVTHAFLFWNGPTNSAIQRRTPR